jgi:hypothetical protein
MSEALHSPNDCLERLNDVHDGLRIVIEMITETMVMSELESHQSMLKAQERIIVLSDTAQTQLSKLKKITTQLRNQQNADSKQGGPHE